MNASDGLVSIKYVVFFSQKEKLPILPHVFLEQFCKQVKNNLVMLKNKIKNFLWIVVLLILTKFFWMMITCYLEKKSQVDNFSTLLVLEWVLWVIATFRHGSHISSWSSQIVIKHCRFWDTNQYVDKIVIIAQAAGANLSQGSFG